MDMDFLIANTPRRAREAPSGDSLLAIAMSTGMLSMHHAYA